MTRSNSLRKLIKEQLSELCDLVYYQIADDDNIYPHIVFDLRNINTGDLNRKDYTLLIDLWDQSNSCQDITALADDVEDALSANNLPQADILPTFYTESRKNVPDDQDIRHIQLEISVQLYER